MIMSDYFKAYRNRIQTNHTNLLKLGKELKGLGYTIKIWKSKELQNSITVLDKHNNGVRVQFNEVPYRWSFEYDIKPSKEQGSGYTGKKFYTSALDLPFTAKDVVEAFKPMYINDNFKNYKIEL